ncbi:hypothetical protein GCM10011344_18630 [Dokdonia pacifica]|uniref:Trehalase n=1 Tax=Dokdonia pacifica TaxID=1627892 RepID=A0A238VS67_9FLAO|nr:trehalase family glycosidase [Dokdonia pacifica]GGG18269.1 hypothetical protein GCM10011344_18630 [Dokdonia pacifica]SNR37021.1 Trehalase [Dokdonia pacifica]
MKEALLERAKQVLDANYQEGGFTIPSKGLYPFQWKWDSGFIAIGLAHYNTTKAKQEIATLLDAQWENGFVPHIVFHNESDTYFPGADFHQSHLHPLSSKKYKTTGMTQPPVLGFVLEEMLRISKDDSDMLSFIKAHIDKVFANHVYFYKNRDPHQEGLVYIYHNWESGTDNSPVWDEIWEDVEAPEYTFERRDTTHVDPSQRPSNREYNHYLHIIEIAKSHQYNDQKIAAHSPLLIQDPLFNAMLIKSNESLIALYERIGNNEEKIAYLKKYQAKSIARFNEKLFDETLGAYIYYDMRNDQPMPYITSSSFAPLYAGIPNEDQAKQLLNVLLQKFRGEGQYLCASFDPTSPLYNPKKYWRGPIWMNLNWILYKGLKRYGFEEAAAIVKMDSISLIETSGFYEYFDARKELPSGDSRAYGGNNFSWSAALLIDLLHE